MDQSENGNQENAYHGCEKKEEEVFGVALAEAPDTDGCEAHLPDWINGQLAQ